VRAKQQTGYSPDVLCMKGHNRGDTWCAWAAVCFQVLSVCSTAATAPSASTGDRCIAALPWLYSCSLIPVCTAVTIVSADERWENALYVSEHVRTIVMSLEHQGPLTTLVRG
jgi:hypothetical protein